MIWKQFIIRKFDVFVLRGWTAPTRMPVKQITVQLPWVPEAFFSFRKKRKEARRQAREEARKKNLWSQPVQTSLPCVHILKSIADWLALSI